MGDERRSVDENQTKKMRKLLRVQKGNSYKKRNGSFCEALTNYTQK